MNTFIIAEDNYWETGLRLDPKRLRKQIVEVQQMHTALVTGLPAHILHHPATQAWVGFEDNLLYYGARLGCALEKRFPGGKKHASVAYCEERLTALPLNRYFAAETNMPPWLKDITPYHKSRLWTKDPQYYMVLFSCLGVGIEEHNAFYPVILDKTVINWVNRYAGEKHWVLSHEESQTKYKTAWAAVQAARSQFKKT